MYASQLVLEDVSHLLPLPTRRRSRASNIAPIQITDFRATLSAVREAVLVCDNSSTSEQQLLRTVASLLENSREVILEFDSLVQYEVLRGNGQNAQGQPKISLRAWLMARPKVIRLQGRLVSLRQNLAVVLNSLTAVQL